VYARLYISEESGFLIGIIMIQIETWRLGYQLGGVKWFNEEMENQYKTSLPIALAASIVLLTSFGRGGVPSKPVFSTK